MFIKLINRITKYYWRLFKSPEDYARYLGVKIGCNCMIATRNWSTEPYLVTIGNNVQITRGVYIHTHGGCHVVRRIMPSFDTFGKVEIGDGSYIGTCTQIMPGVKIGKNCLIAAGSIVCKSVPDNEVWGGNPAKKICTIQDYINKNSIYNLNSYSLTDKEKKDLLLSSKENNFITK